MFTGIIETTGIIRKITQSGSNFSLEIESPISQELKIDQSVSHNGVCLTVESVNKNLHTVTAIDETLKKTTLGSLQVGDIINLERCMILNHRLDGHIVQGHVDDTALCIEKTEKEGSWEYRFQINPKFSSLIIEKGSASINGISLTIFNLGIDTFTVAIIPYTYNHTNIKNINPGDRVNIEFDVIGKYILRMNTENSKE